MIYEIKRGNTVIAAVHAEGTESTKLMGEELVSMSFALPTMINFTLDDTVIVYGKLYSLAAEPVVDKISTTEFRYNLTFHGIKYQLSNVQYLFPDEVDALTISEFDIMGTANEMMNLLIQNANRVQSGWTKGTITPTETKLVSFSEEKCITALAKIAEAFDIEFWVDADKSIHLQERKTASGLTLEYGKSKGLKSISRKPLDAAVVTRLYAVGSEKNIPANYRNGQKRLRMPVPYLEKNVHLYGVIEHTEKFDDIFPKRVGTVTSVFADDPFKFVDAGIDFDLNGYNEYGSNILMNGVNAKIIFQTGQLAGYSLELKQYGFDFATKTFILQKNKDEKDIEIPSALLRPEVGDKYIIVDIMMPQTYVTAAELEVQDKGQAYLDKNCKPRNVYFVASDPFYFKAQNIVLQLGNTVRFKDTDFALDDDIRITGLLRNLQDPYDVQPELAEVSSAAEIIRKYFKQEKAEKEIIKLQKYNTELARKNYLLAREYFDKTFDGEGYYDPAKIRPLSIETKHIFLGSRMQQFALPDVYFYIENDNTSLRNTAGKISHLTIQDSGVREWIIPASTRLGLGAGFYYVYVKAQKIGTNASIYLSTTPIKVEEDASFFHFEVGHLSSISDGFRRLKNTYGFAQINPAELSIGKISDPYGTNYIDLKPNAIDIVANSIVFKASDNTYREVGSAINIAKNEATSAANAYAAAQDNLKLVEAKAHADGIVTAEEQRAIADATAKMEAAKTHAQTLINNVQIGGRNLIRNSNNIWNIINPSWVQLPLSQALKIGETYIFKSNFFENVGSTEFVLVLNNNSYGNDSIAIPYNIPFVATEIHANKSHFAFANQLGNGSRVSIHYPKLEKGNKATDYTIAPEDITDEILQSKTDSINASKSYAEAQDAVKETTTKAYADGVVTAAENRAIQDATNKAEAAKTYAQAQDAVLKTQVESYADGKITAEESARITATNNALQAAKNYADAQDNLAKIAANAYADGIVDAEEARAIADATAKMEAAKNHAQTLVNNVHIGGRNLFKNSTVISPLYNSSFFEKFQKGFHFLPNSWGEVYRVYAIPEPGTFTVSFDAWCNTDGGNLLIDITDTGVTSFAITTIKRKIIFTAESPTSGFVDLQLNTNHFYFDNFKIEKGNKATDWTPAPEDVQNQIDGANGEISSVKAIQGSHTAILQGLNDKTDWISPTVDPNINAFMAGNFAVGNPQTGINALLTGLGGADDVFLAAGINNILNLLLSDYYVTRRGVHRMRHPNGQLGFEWGIINGRLTFNGWHESGTKLFELDPNRGLVNVAYAPESWTSVPLRQLSYSSSTYDQTILTNEVTALIQKEQTTNYLNKPGDPITTETEYFVDIKYSVLENFLAYDYNNGTHPDNLQYEINKGYKINNSSRTNNIADGWYLTEIGIIHSEGSYNQHANSSYTFTVYAHYFSAGKLNQSKVLTITK